MENERGLRIAEGLQDRYLLALGTYEPRYDDV